jgi:methionyl aminopeptidase
MTEKHYGGSTSHGAKGSMPKQQVSPGLTKQEKKAKKIEEKTEENLEIQEIESTEIEGHDELIKAGNIAKQAREYAVSIAKKDMLLIELAEKVENKIVELGGRPAFPVNLSINEVAAHDTPTYNDIRSAYGLLKIDIGVHINGFIADTAVSVDLENDELNKKLINTATECLAVAKENVNPEITLGNLGKLIEAPAKKEKLLTIRNLTGHLIEQYDLHAGISVPNYDTNQIQELGEGVYAVEPFVTNGSGLVRDGKPSGIYVVHKEGSVRDTFAREVLSYILEEYQSLPFCSRWIVKKFGTRALIALKQIENAGVLHQYAQLVEAGNGRVAQAEHTFIVSKDKTVITTN